MEATGLVETMGTLDVITVGRCEYFLHLFGSIISYDVAQLMFPDN